MSGQFLRQRVAVLYLHDLADERFSKGARDDKEKENREADTLPE